MDISRAPPQPPTRDAESENPDAVDVEKNGGANALEQQVSGPPYSIFSKEMKIWIIFLVSVSALISPLGATTYYPALNVMSDVLHITPTLTNISITTYMVTLHSTYVFLPRSC